MSAGTDGADGTDRTDGTDGTDGVDGTDGTDGVDGTDGTDGTDGADRAGEPRQPTAPRRPSRSVIALVTAAVVLIVAVVVVLIVKNSGGGTPVATTSGPPSSITSSSGTSSSTSTGAAVAPPVVPATGLYLGAWAKPTILSQDGRIQASAQVASELGQPLAITHTYRPFTDPIGTPSDVALAAGHYLMISWASDDTQRINSGADDQIIAEHARQVLALRRPVFIRFRWEMDRADLVPTIHSPADFKAAWLHVRAIFDQQHVTNASWVWCPTAFGFDSHRAEAYYPGDASVDWVCADGYAFAAQAGAQTTAPRPFAVIMNSFLDWAKGHHKPVMIGEFGVARSFGAQRGPWIAAVAQTVKQHSDIKGLVYFDDGPSGVWSLAGDAGAFAGLRSLARDTSAIGAPR